MILFLLVLTATFSPARPTVGDRVTIEFAQPAALDPSPHYEILSQSGRRVVIRTFEPQPLVLSGHTGDVAFRNMILPVQSVLKEKDDLAPAPLAPPRAEPYPRLATILIVLAAALAAMTWGAVIWLARRAKLRAYLAPALPPAEQFRLTVTTLRDDHRASRRFAALADATRRYLAASDPQLGLELTTAELLRVMRGDPTTVVAEILRAGDYEKFSPWGAPRVDFAALAGRALTLLPREPQPRESEAAA